jgi:DNA (cytosine-5)-methyltransferase 1
VNGRAYYNEIDPYAAQWLRNLISAGHIAPGDVDERSIVDVRPDDLDGYTQCHFFAGIGGWSLALRIAGWPDNEPVWTGSCPCQPLSVAGKRKGHADERHLWPAFHRLIAERLPPAVFGEQVASKDGREWLAAVRADLEADGYACGAADLCAASKGAPHARQRIFWMADPKSARRRRGKEVAPWRCPPIGGSGQNLRFEPWPDGRGSRSTLAVADILAPSYGIPGRMGRLRAYGNAIVPQVAAAFIEASQP